MRFGCGEVSASSTCGDAESSQLTRVDIVPRGNGAGMDSDRHLDLVGWCEVVVVSCLVMNFRKGRVGEQSFANTGIFAKRALRARMATERGARLFFMERLESARTSKLLGRWSLSYRHDRRTRRTPSPTCRQRRTRRTQYHECTQDSESNGVGKAISIAVSYHPAPKIG